MAKPIPERELKAIEAVVSAHPEGIAIQDIRDELEEEMYVTITEKTSRCVRRDIGNSPLQRRLDLVLVETRPAFALIT